MTRLLVAFLSVVLLGAVAGCRSQRLPQPAGDATALRVTWGPDVVKDTPLPLLRVRVDRDLVTTSTRALKHASKAEIRNWPWQPHVTAEERNKIENALRKVLDDWGREARDAEDWLVHLDKDAKASEFRAVPRLISEFKVIEAQHGFGNDEGRSRAMVIDRILRKIDGVQTRVFGDEIGIRHDTSERHAYRIVRQWNWWIEHEAPSVRRPPWDPRVDFVDSEDEDE